MLGSKSNYKIKFTYAQKPEDIQCIRWIGRCECCMFFHPKSTCHFMAASAEKRTKSSRRGAALNVRFFLHSLKIPDFAFLFCPQSGRSFSQNLKQTCNRRIKKRGTLQILKMASLNIREDVNPWLFESSYLRADEGFEDIPL